jgi:hypothetical protein
MPPRARKARPTGPARIPKRSQGFYRDPETGDKLRSVTTIINQGVPKEALIFWAGNTVAQSAMDNLPKIVRASRTEGGRQEAYDWLRRAHTRKRDERADVGSAVHKLIEAHILGEPAPAALLDDPEMAPYLDHFQAFVRDFGVEFTASEAVVANYQHDYAGTLDWTARLNTRPDLGHLMGDTKTGGELDEKGVYPEAGLQMSAYRHTDTCWLRDGAKAPMPTTDGGVVLHLRPEGYRLIPVRCDADVFAVFLHAKRVAEWSTDLAKTVVGQPLEPTTTTPTAEVA